MTTSNDIDQIATACAKAQDALKPALKESTNPAYKAKYADLASVISAVRVYAQHGVAIFQDVVLADGGAAVTTRLCHSSGQWIEFGPLAVPVMKHDAHGVGSATSYAKRYALSAAALLATEDDDGNAAAQTTQTSARTPDKPPKYDQWLMDLEATVANGTAALLAMWTSSDIVLRRHLTETDPAKWKRMKDLAELVPRKDPVNA